MKAKSGKFMTFLPDEEIVEVSHEGATVLEAALAAGVELNHTCGGFGTCGTCRVWVVSGLEKIGPRNEIEQEMADDRKFAPEERLACQISAFAGLVVRKP
ncbi:2Fe-2S iron-sulfur cluster-binding protein [Bdellovibrio sp. HCB2-146]|uniref:2Fe-2S iron-sulfur cluster-binding protein n=1 Tax=Bdellovibrio sp. HCB2-146 TaxID=3394362 RepID=UPI0039BC6D2F